MHRYTIEKVQNIRRVYLYEVLAPSEELALLKMNEVTPVGVDNDLESEEVNVLSDENLEE
jgi:hypothetical protein